MLNNDKDFSNKIIVADGVFENQIGMNNVIRKWQKYYLDFRVKQNEQKPKSKRQNQKFNLVIPHLNIVFIHIFNYKFITNKK